MWNQTKITQLLGIKYPILLGPMGGDFSTPELLVAVSNAGGLGSLGAYTLTPEQILETSQIIRPKQINLIILTYGYLMLMNA
ncbi:nitronate monooxygenase [Mucilaginibacter sp.]|uniref:nitronate monooxygenase n=1 Tax=Mucilaginibacter sp. TaxID=1882438 RepID=UPI0025FBF46F|nr:nitronate monooxygenase [Mucilaginibacter sp.]